MTESLIRRVDTKPFLLFLVRTFGGGDVGRPGKDGRRYLVVLSVTVDGTAFVLPVLQEREGSGGKAEQ